jgi:hypothetical protein
MSDIIIMMEDYEIAGPLSTLQNAVRNSNSESRIRTFVTTVRVLQDRATTKLSAALNVITKQ